LLADLLPPNIDFGNDRFAMFNKERDIREDKNRLKNFLVNHGAKYGQTGVLYKDHGQENAKFIHTSPKRHGEEEDLGKFHGNRSAVEFFTKLKGKCQFSVEDVEVVYLRPIGFFTRRPMLEC